MPLSGTSPLATYDRGMEIEVSTNIVSTPSRFDFYDKFRQLHDLFSADCLLANNLLTTLIPRYNPAASCISMPQVDIIDVAWASPQMQEGVNIVRSKKFRLELASYIADQLSMLEGVDFVNVKLEDDAKTATYTVLVDMPEYDDELMNMLLDIELDWAEKAAVWALDILCIYLPSSLVERKVQLNAVEIENLA